MIYKNTLITQNQLPDGFKYPKSFLYYLEYNETKEEVVELGCWEERTLIRETDEDIQYVDFFYTKFQKEFPDRNFVPFARLYDDLVYCFNGNDTSGDPAIYVVKTFTNQWGIDNQEFTAYYKDFYEWLEKALIEGQEECACDRSVIAYKNIPSGFKFPKSYLDKTRIQDIDAFMDNYTFFISFANCDNTDSYSSYDALSHLYNDIQIIPFAKGKEDTIHVFVPDLIASEPKVYILNPNEYRILKRYDTFDVYWKDLEPNSMFEKKNYEK